MSFDPDRQDEEQVDEQTTLLSEKMDEVVVELRRIAKLLEILTDTEVGPEDVEE